MNKAYLIKMSVGFSVPIDEDELRKVMTAIEQESVVKLRQGIVRGNLIAGIIEDKERVVVEKIFNSETGEYRLGKPRLLKDIFKQDPKLLEKQ